MKTKAVSLTLFVLILAAGCANPAGEPTLGVNQAADLQSNTTTSPPSLTFGKDGCIYSGPKELPAKFTLTWNAEDLGYSDYSVLIVNLDEGKTSADLSSVALKPLTWVHSMGYDHYTSPGTFTKTWDLTAHANFKEGPVYFVCIYDLEELPAGVAGPINVVR